MQEGNKEKPERLAAFASRLQLLAGRRRLRQSAIAERLSTPGHRVSPQRVGSWFQGRNFPGGDIEHALAGLLGTTRNWLIDGKEDKENPHSTDELPITSIAAVPVESLKQEIRILFERSLSAAGDDITRLGYLTEQIRAHLAPPAHWRENNGLRELPPGKPEKNPVAIPNPNVHKYLNPQKRADDHRTG